MGLPPIRRGLVLFGLSLLLCGSAAAGESWDALEERGASISAVEIIIGDVFDTSLPGENHFIARTANFIHIRSRELTIRRDLLFGTGDPVEARIIRETERSLRERSWIRDARIEPVKGREGGVVARVLVHDAWSLKGGLKFRYEGGDAEWGVDVEEVNLFGFGKTLAAGYEENRERTSAHVRYKDPRLFGSRWKLNAGYAELSDGDRRFLYLTRPYFSLDTPWAAGGSAFNEKLTVRLYELGEEIVLYPSRFERGGAELWKTVTRKERFALRLGVEFRVDRADYGDPVVRPESSVDPPGAGDRDLAGFLLRGQYVEDRFVTGRNLASIGKTEDINLGWDVRFGAGAYSEAFGGSGNAFVGEAGVRKFWKVGDGGVLRFKGWARGRREGGRWEDSRYRAGLSLFDPRLPWQTIAARAYYEGVERPAPESVLTIGASDGLRGYVNDFHSGDRRWVVSLEDRVITDWVIWGMAQVGFVVYADAGAISSLDGGWGRTWADVGGGLRVGNLKSAFGRIVVATIAFPVVKGPGVNDYEIFIGNEIPF